MRSAQRIHGTSHTSRVARLRVVAIAATMLAGSVVGFAQFSVLTHHNDNSRSGANLSETILNTSNVNVNQFGKLFSWTVDGQIYAQPLYVPNVTIGQTTHNVVYVATMRNNLYAFDADDPSANAPLWQVNLGPPVPIADVSAVSIEDAIGITSTPVIDPATGTLYCVAKSKESGSYFQRLHAIDIKTGQERPGSPVVISGSVAGTGDGAVGGVVAFSALDHLNRPGLVLSRGYVYIAFGSHEDQRPYHGWVFSYDATTLLRVGVYNTTPNGWGGGIWSSGQAPAVDENGDLYFMTANGTFNANAGGRDCSSCFVKLSTPLLSVVDWFAPSNQNELNVNNYDLNTSGPALLPGTTRLIGGGKEGIIYVLNRGNMGYFQAGGNNGQIPQSVQITYGQHLHGSPVFWNSPTLGQLVYMWYEEDRLKAFTIANGLFQNGLDPNGLLGPTTQSTMTVPQGMPGGILSLSANGSAPGTGILWAATPLSGDAQPNTVAGMFRAFDASNLGTELWNSRLNAARDDFGNFAKYTPPTIANGKVYLATFSNKVVVYGLLGTQPPPTVASVTPPGGSTDGGTTITIQGTNFVNGATVSVGGTVATGVTLVSSTTMTATTPAHAAGIVDVRVTNPDGQSATLSNAFTFSVPSTAPTVDRVAPGAGPIGGGTVVTLTGANYAAGATVTIGGTPATGVIVVNSTTITMVTPPHLAGAADVRVTNTDGQSGTITGGFTYLLPAPTIATVTPGSGLITGGTAITIAGTNFAAGATVTVSGSAATGVTVVSSTTITAVTPPHAAGAVNVTVTHIDAQSATLNGGFTYVLPAPTIATVTPGAGPATGGTAITITGTNFVAGAAVSVGGSAATGVTVVNSTRITATTPSHAVGGVSVTVTNSDGQSATLANGFTYTAGSPAPTIASVTPGSGATTGGTALTISGTNFAAGAAVTLGGTSATGIAVVNSTTITATSPAHAAGTVSVTVTNTDAQSATRANAFTYVTPTAISFVQVASATPQTPAATVTVAFPTAQTPGDLNVIAVGTNDATSLVQAVQDSRGNTYQLAIGPTTGTGLRQSIYYAKNIVGGTTTVTVTFNQAAAYADVRILEYRGVNTLDVAAGAAGTGTAANSGLATTTGPNELIVGAMMVSSYTAAVGAGFTGRIYTPRDSDLAEDKVAAAAGPNGATATTGGGNWVMQMAAFKLLTAPAPSVTVVAPSSGSMTGATAITITGSNFVAGAAVTIGGTAATAVTVVNGTTITATTPAHGAGAVGVTVVNPDGQSASLANAFTYIAPPPTVSVVTPSSGPDVGGTALTISGTGFAPGATVTVGSTPATGVTVVNGTTITATTPAHAPASVGVTVVNADGQSGTRADAFTYNAPAPTVSGVAPVQGPTAGGTVVTIAGSHFLAGASVSIGGTSAANVTVVDNTTITATTPAHAAGATSVTVINADGQRGTLASAFTYLAPAPAITSVTPPSGPTSGGTPVTITGSDFSTGATVTVGSAVATGVTVVNSTTITATTPAHAWGPAGLMVTNPDGQSATIASAFTYIAPPPAVMGVTPASGPDAGGTMVTISGTGFMAGATIALDGIAATGVTLVNGTTMTAMTPAHAAGAVSVTVTNLDGQSGTQAGAYAYRAPAPTVTAITPPSGGDTGGTAVTIAGTNFLAGASVSIGESPATDVTVVNSTTITATTAAHVGGVVSVSVTNSDGQIATLGNAFTYIGPAPAITGVTPASGSTDGGTAITIMGSDFAASAQVTIGGTAATGVTVVNSTTITATTPAHAAGLGGVTVTNPDGQGATIANAFTYIAPAPTVTGINPASGVSAGGTAVTITGTGFVAGASVTIGGNTAIDVVVVNSTTITATTPAHAAATVGIVVTNPDAQSGSLANAFTYTLPAPTVTGVSPTSGPSAGGTSVAITGTGFVAGARVTLGGTAATGVAVVNANTITATTAAHADGAVSITVTNPDGQAGTLMSAFTYTAPAPDVTGVTPAAGPLAGGTSITITGTHFAAGASVSIGGVPATGVSVINSTTITATTPAHAAGTVSVIVTNADGQSATLASAFSYSQISPTVSSVSPAFGSPGGGTAVTITGTGFVAGATVTVGGIAATEVTVVNSTTITAATPAHASGAVNVLVTNPDGQAATKTNGFAYGITFIQVAAATPSARTSAVQVAYPAAQTAGDLNIVVVGLGDIVANVSSVADSAGNIYQLAIGPTTGTVKRQSIYYARNIRGGANTVTVTFNQAAKYVDLRVLEYRGVSTLDVTAGRSGTGTSVTSGPVTTTAANELIFAADTANKDTTAVGGGFTARIFTAPNGDLAADRIVNAAGAYTATATLESNGSWVMQIVTFK